MKDFSLSTQTEPSIPQAQVSHPRSIEPATDAQQVEPIQKPIGGGTEVIGKPATSTKSTRLFFVDHLRAFLIILVIMHHLAIVYGASGEFYSYHDSTNALTAGLLSILTTIDQMFFMGLFFLISAYFTPGAYDRKGAGLFLRDRFLRLGIPLLIYDILIQPFVLYMAAGFPGSYWQFYTTYVLSLRGIEGPVWFIALLLIFVVFYALWRVCATWWSHAHPRKATPTRSITSARRHPYPTTGAMLLFIVGLTLITFVVRIWFPMDWVFRPLSLMFAELPQYISLFIVGLIAYRRGWLTKIPDAVGKHWLWVALIDFVFVVLVFMLVAIPQGTDYFKGGLHWQALVLALTEAIMCVALCTGLLVFFRTHFNRQGRVWNFLSANAYAAYIFFPVILVSLAYGLHFVTLYPLLKYGLAVLIAVPCCFALGALVRMLPYAKRIF